MSIRIPLFHVLFCVGLVSFALPVMAQDGADLPADESTSQEAADSPQVDSTQTEAQDPAAFLKDIQQAPPAHRRIWQMHWRTVAKQYVFVDGQYLSLDGYDPAHSNSVRVSKQKIVEQLLSRISHPIKVGAREREIMANADATVGIMGLPRLAAGQYGYITSCKIESRIDDHSAIVKEIRVVDPQQLGQQYQAEVQQLRRMYGWQHANADAGKLYSIRHRIRDNQRHWSESRVRLMGIDARRLHQGEYYTGPQNKGMQIYIFDPPEGDYLAAIPTDKLKQGITQEQLIEIITKAGFTAQQFLDKFSTEIRKSPRSFGPAIARVIEAGPTAQIEETATANNTPEVEFNLDTTFGESDE